MRTNIFDKNFTSLVRGKKKILSCPSKGVEIGVTNIPHTHHTTCHNPYQMAQHLPRITPPATLHVLQWKCGQGPWLVRMEPQMGMKPWAVHTREWKWNVSHDDGWDTFHFHSLECTAQG